MKIKNLISESGFTCSDYLVDDSHILRVQVVSPYEEIIIGRRSGEILKREFNTTKLVSFLYDENEEVLNWNFVDLSESNTFTDADYIKSLTELSVILKSSNIENSSYIIQN